MTGTEQLPLVKIEAKKDLGELTHLWTEQVPKLLEGSSRMTYIFWDTQEKSWYKEMDDYKHLTRMSPDDIRKYAAKQDSAVLVGPIFTSIDKVEQYVLYER